MLPWEHTDLLHPGKMNQVAVLGEEANYRFFINGQLAYTLEDGQFVGGQAGLIAEIWGKDNAEFEFDNFKFYIPGYRG